MKITKIASLITLATLSLSAPAFADGFLCQSTDGSLNLKIYDHTQATAGTRNVAIMVLSGGNDSQKGTIAKFSDFTDSLSNSAAVYSAIVARAEKGGVSSDINDEASILGITMGEVEAVKVAIDYNFSEPVTAGDSLSGTIELTQNNGGTISADLSCSRYLKH